MTGRPSDAGAMTPERPKSTPLAEPASTDTHVQVHGRHRRRGPRPRVFMKHVQGCPRHAREASRWPSWKSRDSCAASRRSKRATLAVMAVFTPWLTPALLVGVRRVAPLRAHQPDGQAREAVRWCRHAIRRGEQTHRWCDPRDCRPAGTHGQARRRRSRALWPVAVIATPPEAVGVQILAAPVDYGRRVRRLGPRFGKFDPLGRNLADRIVFGIFAVPGGRSGYRVHRRRGRGGATRRAAGWRRW